MPKKLISLIMLACIFIISSMCAYASTPEVLESPVVSISDTHLDMAKIYRIQHKLTLNTKETGAVMDGWKIQSNKAILKQGRIYIPLRTLISSWQQALFLQRLLS